MTWAQADCHFHELMKLPPAQIDARVIERSEAAGETCYKVSVRNASAVPAVQVWLEVIGGDQGDEVLPAFWSDNALNLMPSEQRELTVRFRTKLLGKATPHLMVEGWNVTPQQWAVDDGKSVPLGMKVTRCDLRRDGGNVKVQFEATQSGPAGPRWTTWPVAVTVDGSLARYVRIAVRSGATSRALFTLAKVSPGHHQIAIGNHDDGRTATLP